MLDTAAQWNGLKLQDDVISTYGDIVSSDDLLHFAGRLSQRDRQRSSCCLPGQSIITDRLQKTSINHKMTAVCFLVTTYLQSAVAMYSEVTPSSVPCGHVRHSGRLPRPTVHCTVAPRTVAGER